MVRRLPLLLPMVRGPPLLTLLGGLPPLLTLLGGLPPLRRRTPMLGGPPLPPLLP